MSYDLVFSPAAARNFRRLSPAAQVRLAPTIDQLADVPRPRGTVKLKGKHELYRICVGDYRIIYEVRDAALVVVVITVGHRREVYR